MQKVILKRSVFICFFICLSTMYYGIISTISISNKAVKVNATPITNKTIVLDAGHGKPDEGAVGFTGTTEEAINLQIVLKLQKLIEQSGANVILTRSDENGIYSADSMSIRSKKVSDIKNREEMVKNSNADIFVSVHLNKYSDSKYSGWQTFYKPNDEKSKQLADKIQEELNNNISENNNRIPMVIKGVYLIDHIDLPSTIVECGFISNPEEEQELKSDEHQSKLAWGIYIGIQKYFSGM